MSINAGGFVGAVMAVEGISDATVLLHGQNGCRKGLILSDKYNPRVDKIHSVDNPVYAGCTTVPYSAINAGDYTGKSRGKLEKALKYISCEDYSLIAVMCSPGVSIVGDDCAAAVRACGLTETALLFDDSEYGAEAWDGFDSAMAKILKHICAERTGVHKHTAVVTGLSIMHKDWYSVRKEISGLLECLGLKAVCFAGADCTVEELRDSVNAEFCIDVSPDYAHDTDEFYRRAGLKVVDIGCSPVGFDATSEFWHAVANAADAPFERISERITECRNHAYSCIIASRSSLRGKTFSIDAPSCISEPLEKFLANSFAMVRDDACPEYCFTDGHRCRMERGDAHVRFIDIGFPTSKVDFSSNPVLGLSGTMYLLDNLFR